MTKEIVHINQHLSMVNSPFSINKINQAINVLTRMKSMSPTLRPSYFKEFTDVDRKAYAQRYQPQTSSVLPIIVQSQTQTYEQTAHVFFIKPITSYSRPVTPTHHLLIPHYPSLLFPPPASFGPVHPAALPYTSMPGATSAVF